MSITLSTEVIQGGTHYEAKHIDEALEATEQQKVLQRSSAAAS